MKRALLVSTFLLCCTTAFAKPVPRLWDVSPLAQMMRADMAHAGTSGLQQLVTTLGTRLILTTESVGVDQLGDVELLWRLATGVQMLTEVQEPSVDLLRVERATAFALFLIGQRYQTRDDFRFAIDGLEVEPSGHGKLLLAAVRGMKDYGAQWFAATYDKLAKRGADALDVESRHQHGRLLLDTGRAAEAATLLSELFAKAPDHELARSMCEAMVALGEPVIVTRLEAMKQRLDSENLVAFAAEIDACLVRHADEVAATAFDRSNGTSNITAVVAQVARLTRLERFGAAEALARHAIQLDPELGLVAAAELFFKLQRWQSLATSLGDAKQRGISNARLADLEVLSLAVLAVRRAMGAAVGQDTDPIALLEASRLPPLVWRAQIAVVRTAQWLGAAPEHKASALAKVDQALADLLKHHDKEPTALGVVLISMVGTDRLDAALKLLAPKVAALEKTATKKGAPKTLLTDTLELRSLLARVELGVGFRERDPARLKRALAAMKKLTPPQRALMGTAKAAELQLAEVTGTLALEALDGGIKSTKLIETLGEWNLPRTTTAGRQALQARALTIGTLAVLAGQDGVAVHRWLEARSLAGGSVAFLAGGLVQQVTGDIYGAKTLCEQADPDERPALAQVLAACVAHGAEGEEAKKAWARVLSLWHEARLPQGTLPTARPLFYGTFDIGVRVATGEPIEVLLDARPVLTLVPELVPERSKVEAAVH